MKNAATGEITIYEMKAGQVQSIFIYQLRMYWDGLALAGEQPTLGLLVAEEYQDVHQSMVSRINELLDPSGKPYKLELKRLSDFNL